VAQRASKGNYLGDLVVESAQLGTGADARVRGVGRVRIGGAVPCKNVIGKDNAILRQQSPLHDQVVVLGVIVLIGIDTDDIEGAVEDGKSVP
jgi:hypothetical protein